MQAAESCPHSAIPGKACDSDGTSKGYRIFRNARQNSGFFNILGTFPT